MKANFPESISRLLLFNVLTSIFAGLAYAAEVEAPSPPAGGAWVTWPTSAGGNGHWYRAVRATNLITWATAFTSAQSEGGYLATITSAEENAFVFALVDFPQYWNGEFGPFLGGYQPPGAPEPAGGWTWITGEPWDYANWAPGQPDNGNAPEEEGVHFWEQPGGGRAPTWNDFPTNMWPNFVSYVIERDTPPLLIPARVVAWGDNSSGKTNVPTDLTNVVAISAGEEHSMVLLANGTVVAWGSNGYGQCNVPIDLSNVVAIDAGNLHSIALRIDGTTAAWGQNVHGQCNVPAGLTNVVAIAAGGTFSLALKADQTVVAWGSDSFGEVSGTTALSNVVAIAAGTSHGLALRGDRTVVAWGYNANGESTVPVGLTDVVAIAAGNNHCVVLKEDGTVLSWGRDNAGQSTVPAGLSDIVAIAGGYFHSLALKRGGTVIAWGSDSAGQSRVPANLPNALAIAAGGYHSLALVGVSPLAIHDVSHDFSLAANPNGVWSYGWKSNLAGGFALLPLARTINEDNGVPMQYWELADGQLPIIKHNATTNTAISDSGQQVMPPGSVMFTAGLDGAPQNFGAIRFTVPAQGDGIYGLESAVRCYLDGDRSGDVDYHVVVNGTEAFSEFLPPRSSTGYSNTLSLAAGDTVDFMVGRGADGRVYGSGLKIQATLNLVTATPVAPTILAQPQSRTVLVGESAALEVVARGTPPLQYQWRKDGADLTGQVTSVLDLTNAQTNQAGGYTVVVANAAGSVTSQVATLTVKVAPLAVHDVSRDFLIAANPNGVWSYGWKSSLEGAFSLLPHTRDGTYGNGVPCEYRELASGIHPIIVYNPTTDTGISEGGQGVYPPGTIFFTPGFDGTPQNFCVIRFTVPGGRGGIYLIESTVRSYLDGGSSGDTDYHVVVNGLEVFGEFLAAQSGTGYSNTLSLATGDTVDFMVGRGADEHLSGSGLKIQAKLIHLADAGDWVTWSTSQGGNGHSYLPVLVTNWISWRDADQLARNVGGYLATITSPDENAFVFGLVNSAGYLQPGRGPLLGGYQVPGSAEPAGGWTWVTGEPWVYSNWADGQPDNGGEQEDAVHFLPDGHWNDKSAVGRYFSSYVVERDALPPHHTYQTVSGAFTWHQAKADAEARGGHLATITSQAEFDNIRNLGILPSGSYWLGATDEGQEGTWAWVTGEPWSFSAWMTGEPNNLGSENYLTAAASVNHMWNDWGGESSSLSFYLMEIERPPPFVPPAIVTQPQSQTVLAGTNMILSVTVTGTSPLTYQWKFNGTNLDGATFANLLLTNVQLEDAGDYTVAVTNSAGHALSEPATLTVLAPPSITTQPKGQTAYWGKSVSFQVRAKGTLPMTYLWYVDGFPILWATNASLTLTNLEMSAGGDYWVEVCNDLDCVTSAPARLVVNPAGISLGLYPGVTVDGVVGKTYGIQYTTTVSQTNSWLTLTNFTLTQPVQLWIDTEADTTSGKQPKRFYRVVPVP